MGLTPNSQLLGALAVGWPYRLLVLGMIGV